MHVRVAPGTNETTPATDLSAQDKSTKDAHAAKALARQQQNHEGYGNGMALGYAEEYHPGLDSQR